MAEEVGAAYVSLIPSARGFSKIAQRELNKELRGNRSPTIRVRPEVEVEDFEKTITAKFTGARQSVKIPVNVEVDANQVTREMVRVSRQERVSVDTDVDAGDLLTDTRRAVRVVQATNPTINIDTDVDRAGRGKGGFLSSLLGLGPDAAQGGLTLGGMFTSGWSSALANPISGIPVIVASVIAGGFALALSGVAAAAATLAGAGLGAIFVGAFALRNNPGLQKAMAGFTSTVGKVLESAAAPLQGPLVTALALIADAVVRIGPQLRDMFAGIAPFIPILAEGVAGFLEAFTPGLVQAVIASGPVLERLAWALPDLGDALGDFLSMMADVSPEAADFLGILIRLTADLIRILGVVLRFGAEVFNGLMEICDLMGQAMETLALPVQAVVEVFRGNFSKAYRLVEAFVGGVFLLFDRLVSYLPDSARKAINRVSSEIGKLPGRIRSFFANAGSWLVQAGRNIINGLISGILSRISGVGSAIARAAQTVRNYWPFSPAKTGPLSGHGSLFHAGQNLMTDLSRGMTKAAPRVEAASTRLAGAVGFTSRTSAVAPAGGELRWSREATGDQILDALRGMIDIRYGGSPSAALGRYGKT